jgi:excisionase family DNA binding protein
MDNDSKLLTIQQTASLLNVKESLLRSLVFKKQIPYHKIGRLLRFSEAEILTWVNSRKQEEESCL